MTERPILLFPQPEVASRSNLGGRGGQIRTPSFDRQSSRLMPMFEQLQNNFNERRVEIQQTAAGLDSEQVLVIEVIGSVEKFANAVKHIEGFEWMGEWEVEEIAPDEDFFDAKNPDKELNGRLYLVMTNQRALEEMLSLWQRYQADQAVKLETGLNKFKDIFKSLKMIRRWGIEDRLLETGVLEEWSELLEHDSNRVIRLEVELWYRANSQKRQAALAQVSSLITERGGRILGQCVIPEVAYHALLVELSANEIRDIIANRNTALVKSDNVMFFRPAGQMSAGDRHAEGDLEQGEALNAGNLPTGNPVAAILDGMPLANHRMLSERIIVDDPDGWASSYPAVDRSHGTAMASLVIHGDLSAGAGDPLKTPVYMRPIMKPNPADWQTSKNEIIPEDILAVDLIHRAVKRIFEGEGSGAVAPTVKIINLSIGDPSRQFLQIMSPMAKLLDWLSVKYNVLFVISAGNHTKPISFNISRTEFSQLPHTEAESGVVKILYEDARHRRLLSPAESLNGLTIGCAHLDQSTVRVMGDRLDLFNSSILPSPISSFGSGYRRSVKPDIVFSGGKQLYRTRVLADPVVLEPVYSRSAPGNMVAVPGSMPGDTSSTAFCRGTSNSAALVTRAGVICHDLVTRIFNEQATGMDHAQFVAPLLKAMIVHGAQWGTSGERLAQILQSSSSRQLKSWISRWLGYGLPEIERVLGCTEQRATLLGFGALKDNQAQIFRLPLPVSLGSRTDWRRLTVTLAWLSPIAANSQKYRVAGLWFETNTEVVEDRSDGDWNAVRRGTLQHEIFEGERAVPFTDGDTIEIKVNCRNDAGKIVEPIPYGLAVTLEVKEDVDIAVYDEVRSRIQASVRINSDGE